MDKKQTKPKTYFIVQFETNINLTEIEVKQLEQTIQHSLMLTDKMIGLLDSETDILSMRVLSTDNPWGIK